MSEDTESSLWIATEEEDNIGFTFSVEDNELSISLDVVVNADLEASMYIAYIGKDELQKLIEFLQKMKEYLETFDSEEVKIMRIDIND